MPDDETGSPRKSRGLRKSAGKAFADDWPDVEPAAAQTAASEASEPPARQRIARAMARAGLCSRRDAESWILAGRVAVNGETLTSPARDVGPEDHVEVDGAPLPQAEKTRLFLFHKPRGLVTSDRDPEGRATVADHLREHWPAGPRVMTVGRLDINTEGLLLLTNDGGLARTLELPKTGWLRRYRVRANGETTQAELDALAAGITLDGVDYAGIEAKLDRVQGANCWLTMGLREGKNREIKRVLEHLGLEVNRLIRLSFGPFQLLDLEEGKVEEVRTRVLRDQLGPALSADAGVDFGEVVAPAPIPAPAERSTIILKRKEALETGRRGPDESRPRSDRAASAAPRSERSAPTRRRDQPATRADTRAPDDRAQGRPRRHVSTLRRDEAEAARSGPRRRVERSDTRDVNDRTVAVERKMSVRPARMSPSAEGKRARIARSGGGRKRFEAGDGDRTAAARPAGRRGAGADAAGGRPARGTREPGTGAGRRHGSATRDAGDTRAPRRAPRGDGDASAQRSKSDGSRAALSGRGARAFSQERPRRYGAERSNGRSPDAERSRPASGQADRAAARRTGPGEAKPSGRTFGDKRSGGGRPLERSSSGKPAGGRSLGGKPGGGNPGGGKSGGRKSGGAKSGGGRPGGGRSGGGRPSGGGPAGGKPPRGSGRPKR